MAGATVVTIAAAWFMAGRLGGNAATTNALLYGMVAGSVVTFLPAVLRISKEFWGVTVLLSGVGRSLIIIALCYVFRENNAEIIARPLFMSAAAGAILLLVIETVTTIKILSALERQRDRAAGASA